MKQAFAFFLITLYLCSHSQNTQWAKGLGTVNDDYGISIAHDGAGNRFVTGTFTGTIDLDPGSSTYTAVSANAGQLPDAFILKLDTNGNFIWAKSFGGGISNISIAYDPNGGLYVSGTYSGTCDFDPGPNTLPISSNFGSNDVFVTHLDAAGNYLWTRVFGGLGADYGRCLTVDAAGSVYTSGSFMSQVDFDPGLGTASYTASGIITSDIFVSKLDVLGNFQWVAVMGGPSYAEGVAITNDASGNLYLTGYYDGVTDFDGGTGTYTLTSNGGVSPFVTKLNGLGGLVWAQGFPCDISAAGWDVSVDLFGNVYAAGYFMGAIDFDPGAGVNTVNSMNSNADAFVTKFDAAGNLTWVLNYMSNGSDYCHAVRTDALGDVYIAGNFSDTMDFDPGAATFTLPVSGNSGAWHDVFVSKLSPAGNFMWAKKMGGPDNDFCTAMDISQSGSIYLTGFFGGVAEFDTGVGTNTLSSNGNADVFVAKLSSCPSPAGAITGPATVCNQGGPIAYSITPVSGASGYVWALSSGTLNSGQNTNSVGVTFGTGNSTLSVIPANACSSAQGGSLAVVINAAPTLSVTSNRTVVCQGTPAVLIASGAASYTWSPGNSNLTTIVVSPVITTTYNVAGTGTNGCVSAPATLVLQVSSCIGIEENTAANDVSAIYPNPTAGACLIEIRERSVITVFDLTAKELMRLECSQPGLHRLDLSEFRAGIYIVEIYSNESVQRQKIVKE